MRKANGSVPGFKIRLARLQEQVIVISHQIIGMNQPARATARLT